MSETPTLPTTDEITDRIAENADRILNDPQNVSAYFEHAQYQLSPELQRTERAATLDLYNEEAIDLARWTKEELEAPVQAIERIEEARPPKTRAQEVEESLFYLTDKELLSYAIANTKAVWALKHLV